ncbi:MAG TPA: methyl-accepting chemotaxis protein [bacterium]|nr:methyl-accepting chemotaxis protein [bacterium]
MMRGLFQMKLQYRLLSGFLLCALIAGISGGVAILAMQRIHDAMRSTIDDIGMSIDRQGGKEDLVHSIVLQISDADSEKVLQELEKQINGSIASKQPAGGKETRENDLSEAVRSLIAQKRAQLGSRDRLSSLCQSMNTTLGNIDEAISSLVESKEADVNFNMENVFGIVKDMIGKNEGAVLEEVKKMSASPAGNLENVLKELDIRFSMGRTGVSDSLDTMAEMVHQALSTTRAALSVRSDCQKLNALLKESLLASDVATIDGIQGEIGGALRQLNSVLGAMPNEESIERIRSQCEQLSGLIVDSIGVKKELIRTEGDLKRIGAEISEYLKNAAGATVAQAVAMKDKADGSLKTSTGLVRKWELVLLIMGGSVLVIALLAGVFLSLSIARPLQRVIEKMTDGAERVASFTGNLQESSMRVSEGASEQAAAVEETSASLEEISASTKQNADNAQQANTMVLDAHRAAQNGRDAMARMSETINKIKASSDETVKIIKTIDEVAFQTNLLALNAAVEAARAGESGKGFAVVAEEVRSLARRSAEAAKDTAKLIEEAKENAEQGVIVSNEVSRIFEKITEAVAKITQIMSDVSSATAEQAQGIDQITLGIGEVDKVTQINVMQSEEIAASSRELAEEADVLHRAVNTLVAMVGGVDDNARKYRLKSAPVKRLEMDEGAYQAPGIPAGARPEEVIPFDEDEG